jgi:uncharacterized phage protein (TIGR02220 family)
VRFTDSEYRDLLKRCKAEYPYLPVSIAIRAICLPRAAMGSYEQPNPEIGNDIIAFSSAEIAKIERKQQNLSIPRGTQSRTKGGQDVGPLKKVRRREEEEKIEEIKHVVFDQFEPLKLELQQDLTKLVLKYLNRKLGRKPGRGYRHTTKSHRKLIEARAKEGAVEQDFYTVIDKKYTQWIGTDKEQYIWPPTLFSGKFWTYLEQPAVKARPSSTMSDAEKRELRWAQRQDKSRYIQGDVIDADALGEELDNVPF